MISPEALRLNEILRNAPKAVDMDLAHQRQAGEHAEDMTSEPQGVTYEEAYSVDGLWATPRSWDGHSAIMYLYGGGYVISSPHSRRKLAGHLANASGACALVPRYHLAPESPFPAAVEDAAADYRWLLERGHRPEQVVIAGDSSAGGLTVATMLKLREDGVPPPRGCYPHIAVGRSVLHRRDARDPRHSRPHGHQVQSAAHGRPVPPRRGSTHAVASPLYADLSGLPPLLVIVGGDEALLDDSVRLVRLAGMAGVDVTLYIGAGMQHIFPIYCGVIPEADAAGRDDRNVYPLSHLVGDSEPDGLRVAG